MISVEALSAVLNDSDYKDYLEMRRVALLATQDVKKADYVLKELWPLIHRLANRRVQVILKDATASALLVDRKRSETPPKRKGKTNVA